MLRVLCDLGYFSSNAEGVQKCGGCSVPWRDIRSNVEGF